MDLSLVDRTATLARRTRVASRLAPNDRALLFAGSAPPRNYAAATYPFRASSHFLYLVGLPLEGGVLALSQEEAVLYLPPPAIDDALWHGPQPSFRLLGETLGFEVRPLDTLRVGARDATIAAVSAATRIAQEAVLSRSLAVETDADQRLVDAMIFARLRHDAAAIRELRRAADATWAGHLEGMAVTRAGKYEYEVCAAMEGAFLARGMGTAYGSIVTIHGEVLHNHAHHHVLSDGDLLLADVGAETDTGWAGDVTRTWPVSGRFTETQRALYQCVLDSQYAALDCVLPGARYRDVHLAASRKLAEGLVALGILRGDVDELVADGVHALFFPHGVGHLIGLDVHDMEDLGDRAGYAPGRDRSTQFGLSYLRCDRDLEPGMAVTIEPGFYSVPAILEDPTLRAIGEDRMNRDELAKFSDVRGIRIEDDVLVTADGHDVLTAKIPKEPREVEAAVGVR